MKKLPRDQDNDYTRASAAARRDVVRTETGVDLVHVGTFSMDPAQLPGNVD